MAWAINYSDTALKQLKKLDKGVAKEIFDYLDKKIATLEDPTSAGKGLGGTLATYWRYRVRDLRVICYVDKGAVTVLVLRVGHGSEVYEGAKKIAGKAAKDVAEFEEARKLEQEKSSAKKKDRK